MQQNESTTTHLQIIHLLDKRLTEHKDDMKEDMKELKALIMTQRNDHAYLKEEVIKIKSWFSWKKLLPLALAMLLGGGGLGAVGGTAAVSENKEKIVVQQQKRDQIINTNEEP